MLATETDACYEFARNVGFDNPDHEWILTPFDSWVRNPAYTGKPGRHPEDDYDENGIHYADELFGTSDEYAASLAAGKARLAANLDDGSDDLPF